MRLKLIIASVFVLAVGTTGRANAQDFEDRFSVSIDAQAVIPVFGLADRFDPFPTVSLGIGRRTNANTLWEVRLQRYKFPRADQISLLPDSTRSPAVADSLELSLEIIGGGLFMHRYFNDSGRIRPFAVIGGGFYYWTDIRGAFENEHLLIERSKRSQWSGGAHAGLGSEYFFTDRFALQAVIDYTIMFGELWPTLALGLENVSTFQFASGRLGLRYYF